MKVFATSRNLLAKGASFDTLQKFNWTTMVEKAQQHMPSLVTTMKAAFSTLKTK